MNPTITQIPIGAGSPPSPRSWTRSEPQIDDAQRTTAASAAEVQTHGAVGKPLPVISTITPTKTSMPTNATVQARCRIREGRVDGSMLAPVDRHGDPFCKKYPGNVGSGGSCSTPETCHSPSKLRRALRSFPTISSSGSHHPPFWIGWLAFVLGLVHFI